MSTGNLLDLLLALLGFLMAFTFGMAGSRFDARKQLLLDEANAIGTAHLRSGFLPEPHRVEVRQLLCEYLGVRLAVRTLDDIPAAAAKSDDLHRRLWVEAEACTEKSPNPVTAMFVQSLNELIDLHTKRLTTVLEYRVPASILVLVFSAVLLVIVDLDRPQQGMFSISKQALLDLQTSLNAPPK